MTAPSTSAVSIKDSLRRLRAAQKSNAGAPLYSVVVNRPLGRLFAAVAHQLGLTPNVVTAVSALFTYSGIVLLAICPPTWPVAAVITACLVLGYGLDAADGQLARLRGGGSLLGEWLDHVIDSFKIATLHLAVLVMVFRHYALAQGWLLLPITFAAISVVHFFGFLLTDLLTRVHFARKGEALPSRGPANQLMAVAKLPTDYGFLCWTFLLIPLPVAFLTVYGLMALALVGYTLLVLPKWARGIRALDQH